MINHGDKIQFKMYRIINIPETESHTQGLEKTRVIILHNFKYIHIYTYIYIHTYAHIYIMQLNTRQTFQVMAVKQRH